MPTHFLYTIKIKSKCMSTSWSQNSFTHWRYNKTNWSQSPTPSKGCSFYSTIALQIIQFNHEHLKKTHLKSKKMSSAGHYRSQEGVEVIIHNLKCQGQSRYKWWGSDFISKSDRFASWIDKRGKYYTSMWAGNHTAKNWFDHCSNSRHQKTIECICPDTWIEKSQWYYWLWHYNKNQTLDAFFKHAFDH